MVHEGPVSPMPLRRDSVGEAAASAQSAGGVRLDPSVLRRVQAGTARAEAMLQAFVLDADGPNAPTLPPVVPEGHAAATGLDARHSELARRISTRSVWDRGDLETEARHVGVRLLASGIERINEAAIEKCDEPLLSPTDTVDRFRVDPIASEVFR